MTMDSDGDGLTAALRTALFDYAAGGGDPGDAALARAILSNQDAERKLHKAKGLRAEADWVKSKVKKTAVEETEVLCAEMRAEGERHLQSALQLHEEAEAKWQTASQEMERAGAACRDAEVYVTALRKEAEDYRQRVMAAAHQEIEEEKERATDEARESVRSHRERVDEEIRQALNAIEMMQQAVQAEFEAQQSFTEALRIRALAPKGDALEQDLLVLAHANRDRANGKVS